MFRRAGVFAAVVVAFMAGASAAEAAIDAKGSVEQVSATGLIAGAKVRLVDAGGKKVAARKVNPLGGVLFRNVKPGSGYTVKSRTDTSGPLTVLSTQPAPPSADVYNQDIPSSGYDYLTSATGPSSRSTSTRPRTSATWFPALRRSRRRRAGRRRR